MRKENSLQKINALNGNSDNFSTATKNNIPLSYIVFLLHRRGCHGKGCENTEAPPPDSDNETEQPLMADFNERNILDILETLD